VRDARLGYTPGMHTYKMHTYKMHVSESSHIAVVGRWLAVLGVT
jgi:hypothetical protein